MVKNNEWAIPKNIDKPIEMVYEIKNEKEYQVPSFEEFMKDYKVDEEVESSYRDELSGHEGIGKSKSYGSTGDDWRVAGGQHSIHRLNRRFDKEFKTKNWEGNVSLPTVPPIPSHDISVKASLGVGGAIASGEIDNSFYKYKEDGKGEVRFASGSIGGEIGAGLGGVTASYSAGVDLMNIKFDGIQTKLGVDVGSGFTAGSDGVEIKGFGLGFSVGKKMGISTPLGGFSVDTEETCVVQ